MKVSTRGRYALRVLVDLATHSNGDFISIREVAQRQQISFKYLEQIMPILVRNQLVEAAAGRRGGYRLAQPAHQIKVGQVLRFTEGSFAPVPCVETESCERSPHCATKPMWQKFNELAAQFFDGISIEDLTRRHLDPFGQSRFADSDSPYSSCAAFVK